MDLTIAVVDPGDTTGFLVARVIKNSGRQAITITSWGEWTDLDSYLQPLHQQALCSSQVIVMEDYRIYPHKTDQHAGARPYAIEVIGHIRLLAYQYSIPVHFQMASQAKQQWPTRRLTEHYSKGTLRMIGSRHCKDALRHLLTYVENKTEYGIILNKKAVI